MAIIMADNQLLNDNDVGGDEDIFVYTGGDQEVPRGVKRVRIAENVDTIAERVFDQCQQLIEVEGHNKIKKIERRAFYKCIRLRSVANMTGLIEIEENAFNKCWALSELELDKLEIIGYGAFSYCPSLRSISMPSIRSVGEYAFIGCAALTDAVFGEKLEKIEQYAFLGCTALRNIVIPLRENLIDGNSFFFGCIGLSRIDVLDGVIKKNISTLHMESWRNEMKDEIDRINQTLQNTPGIQKAIAIQEWITIIFKRMKHYKSEHHILVKEAMTLLELALWKANLHENEANDVAAAQEEGRVTRGQRKRARKSRCITSGASIVIKNVLPFLALE